MLLRLSVKAFDLTLSRGESAVSRNIFDVQGGVARIFLCRVVLVLRRVETLATTREVKVFGKNGSITTENRRNFVIYLFIRVFIFSAEYLGY